MNAAVRKKFLRRSVCGLCAAKGAAFVLAVIAVTLACAKTSYPKAKGQSIGFSCSKDTAAVEIADTEDKRNLGLMFRNYLDSNSGMLFVFKDANKRTFWMKNTYIPLSIAYISDDGTINEIYDMKPLDISVVYPSRRPAKYALEMNKGWFDKHNIAVGCKVLLPAGLSGK